MSDTPELVFETDLDAPPEKVWRALSVREYLDRWLQPPSGTIVELLSADANRLLTYRLSDATADSIVRLEIEPNGAGGTSFRLIHAMPAANSNEPSDQLLMLAA